ncbi:MAG: polyisoprenoid-binding protein [Bacteroidetes bacterium]|nr:MAG: polyisoprenoid-binding protein [Bacteroidota bacterium]
MSRNFFTFVLMFKHRMLKTKKMIMKKLMFSLIALAVAGSFAAFRPAHVALEAPTWTVDAVHSSISFEVRHFFSNVLGTFDKFEGTVKFDPEDLKTSSVEFSVDVSSVNTKNERRDNHLKSADFFDVEKWPTMSFKSTSITKGEGENEYIVKGNMTIRDVTKEMEIPVKFLGAMPHPMRKGAYVGGFTTEFTINRTEFGVGTGNWAATTVIGDEVKVRVNVEVNRQES